MLPFASDYMEGAHSEILKSLTEGNFIARAGYGTDEVTKSAKEKILNSCKCLDGEVYFLVGGTQTNEVVIDALVPRYAGVIAANTGHVSLHEAGAIEFTGHKVLQLPQKLGKLDAETIENYLVDFYADDNAPHMVQPGMVYLSHPTEYGTLYTENELAAIHEVCQKYKLPLYLDGARLAYALAANENELTLPKLAKYCDAFYIGGTKCGALLGEAVVLPKKNSIPHFFTTIKQHGALLAKGWLLGVQFDVLFTNGLYENIGKTAIVQADRIRKVLQDLGYSLFFATPTNQTFVIMPNDLLPKLGKEVSYSFWEKYDDNSSVIRLATSWATTAADVDKLIATLKNLR